MTEDLARILKYSENRVFTPKRKDEEEVCIEKFDGLPICARTFESSHLAIGCSSSRV